MKIGVVVAMIAVVPHVLQEYDNGHGEGKVCFHRADHKAMTKNFPDIIGRRRFRLVCRNLYEAKLTFFQRVKTISCYTS